MFPPFTATAPSAGCSETTWGVVPERVSIGPRSPIRGAVGGVRGPGTRGSGARVVGGTNCSRRPDTLRSTGPQGVRATWRGRRGRGTTVDTPPHGRIRSGCGYPGREGQDPGSRCPLPPHQGGSGKGTGHLWAPAVDDSQAEADTISAEPFLSAGQSPAAGVRGGLFRGADSPLLSRSHGDVQNNPRPGPR